MFFLKLSMKKAGSFVNKHHIFLLSGLIPIVILEIAYVCQGIFPFGNRNVLIIDLYHQYAPFLADLRRHFLSPSSFLYSWSGGLGTNYMALYAYYLASPLNILIVMFPEHLLSEAVLVLILLKIGLAGACFSVYLRNAYRDEGLHIAAFSVLYALSGYVLAYSWNIMWLDGIYLLPLVILGLHRMARGDGGFLFCIPLAAAIFSNFYIAFFICIFIILYFPVCLFQYHTAKRPFQILKHTMRFAGYSVLAVGLTAVLLLPTWASLRLTSASGDAFPKTITHYFDLFDYISRHFALASPTIREGMPKLYCGIAVLILLPAYFLSRSVRHREKLWHAILLFVFIISFNMNVLNFIWHGLHFPNQLPYRYSFVYTFLLLSMAYRGYKSIPEFTGKQLGAVCAAILGLLVLSQKLDGSRPDMLMVYAGIALVIAYTAVLTCHRLPRVRLLHMAIAFFLTIVAETTLNTLLTIDKIDQTEYYSVREGYSAGQQAEYIRNQIKKIAQTDKGFYRMETYPAETNNDPFLYGYRGLSVFSSTFPEKPVKMMRNLGYQSNDINSFKHEGSTILLDSIFSIKYLIRRTDVIKDAIRLPIASADKLTVYENPYSLSPGFLADASLAKWHSRYDNPFDAQNALMHGICGSDDMLLPLEIVQGTHQNIAINSSWKDHYRYERKDQDNESTAIFEVKIKEDGQNYLYLDIPSDKADHGFVTIGEKKLDFHAKRSTMIDLGFCKSGTKVEVNLVFNKSAPKDGDFGLFASRLDQPNFEQAISLLRKQSLTVDRFEDTRMTGHITAPSDGLLVMSIPFDPGWKVRVDGRSVEARPLDDALLSFDLKAGFHSISLQYVPDKLIPGLVISLMSIVLLIVIFLISRRLKHYYAYPASNSITSSMYPFHRLNTHLSIVSLNSLKLIGFDI